MTTKTIITISRQYGSGGRLIGKKLAENLGIPFYDKELLTLAAEQSGYSREVFESVDENAASSLLYTLSMNAQMIHGAASVAPLPINDKVFLIQTDVIRKIANEGPCVIVGRCADYILKENPDRVAVFLYADREKRLQRIIDVYGVSAEKAPDVLQKTEKRRTNYYNFYTGSKHGIAANYDLSINSGLLGIEESALLIQRFVELKEQHT